MLHCSVEHVLLILCVETYYLLILYNYLYLGVLPNYKQISFNH